ncbi:MAG: hypothetical protein ACRBFS_13990 [Aureispira sp.]
MDQIKLKKGKSYLWKFVILATTISLLTIIFNRDNWYKNTALNIDKIILEIELFPSSHKKEYILENRKLTAQLVDKSSGQIDSILHESTIDSLELANLVYLIDSFKTNSYVNTCIEDGQILTLTVEAKNHPVKTIVFQNHYNSHLHKIIYFINLNVSKPNSIFYRKNDSSYSSETCF